ncbi:hypothetical protein [Aquipuribacter hungaricus]|uniref:hypothetical protein n=1 Tax=Aquipuribacter hungaricus TaxID=545624 RepID=UPI00361497E3
MAAPGAMTVLEEWFDPFGVLAGTAGKIVTDAWTVAMLAMWNAGLWVLRMVLYLMDAFVTPDLRADGPGAELYRTTLWLAGALVLLMGMLQLGVTAARRDGQSLARVGIGFAQFAVVWGGWLSYIVALVAACGGLTRALMQALLDVTSWSAWKPFEDIALQDVVDGTVATVLGLLGLLLCLAALGHLLVMLTRAGALMVLAATAPIAAAGLLSDAGRAWFWKSLRWTHAAALSPVLMVLVLGAGVQATTGVANGLADGTMAAIGTAIPGVLLILIACFSPLALFKLLAFVDPGTSSGAALRRGLAVSGGVQGLLGGGSSSGVGAGSGGGASVQASDGGRSSGESAGEDVTSARFGQAERGWLSSAGGALGTAAASGLGLMQRAGTAGAAVGADAASQMGVGSSNYFPDPGERPHSNRTGSGGTSTDRGPGRGGSRGNQGGDPTSPRTSTAPAARAAPPLQGARPAHPHGPQRPHRRPRLRPYPPHRRPQGPAAPAEPSPEVQVQVQVQVPGPVQVPGGRRRPCPSSPSET